MIPLNLAEVFVQWTGVQGADSHHRRSRQPLMGAILGGSLLMGWVGLIPSAPAQASLTLPEGTHLYGQSPEPNRPNQTYMVVQVKENQVVGAFYQPSSSFDCFQGTVSGSKLDLVVVDSYDQTTHPYQLALTTAPTETAGANGAAAPVQIENFYPITELSDLDRHILATCSAP